MLSNQLSTKDGKNLVNPCEGKARGVLFHARNGLLSGVQLTSELSLAPSFFFSQRADER